ncbi:MAG TPA: hypothetical protein VH165_08390 [Kofleriaceae bacterium]|nr:hypothetical protein [Kofleriaceae bacterium]
MLQAALAVVASVLCGIACSLAPTPAPMSSGPTPAQPPAPASSSSPAACVTAQAKPPPVLPWNNVEALCAAPHGTAWHPPRFEHLDQAALDVRTFVRDESYKQLGWLHDADWRLTGPFDGCACPNGTAGGCVEGVNKGPHPAVKIYYSPEVIDWMCKYRRGKDELPNAPAMPDGAMIIKEMLSPAATQLALVPGSNRLWIAPIPDKPADYYDHAYGSWTILIKDQAQSADGWYWAFYDKTSPGNPPLWDRCAFTERPYPGMDGAPVTSPPPCQWLPTYGDYAVGDQQYPNAQFGNYCVYCHASAQGQATFASFTNLMGKEIAYPWSPSAAGETEVDAHTHALPHLLHLRKVAGESRAPATHLRAQDSGGGLGAGSSAGSPGAGTGSAANQCPENPFPLPDADALPGWRAAFPELDLSYAEIWSSRLPSHTYDHAVSKLGVPGAPPVASEFVTSDQCEGCHEAGGAGQLATPNMIERVGAQQIDLTPWAEWSVSPMGLAGRDPVFHSQLELERNVARGEPGLANIRDCIDNTCLHCHGGPGARQFNIDTAGQGPKGDPCKAFLPPPAERPAANYDGKLFTERMVTAWRDEDPGNAKYGALARDGIDCAFCHHIADKDLDLPNLAKTFTGNFRIGSPFRLFGPFPDEASNDEVRTKPMVNALGITPELGKQIAGSEMCGTCHTVVLPVFDDAGVLAGTAFEQTTYLEWLLSNMSTWRPGNPPGRSCQDCHMPHDYRGKPLDTGIANVQGTAYPEADFVLPKKDVDLPNRQYHRHKLYGLNVFLTAYAQQYPLLLGVRQQDYMNPNVTAPLVTGLSAALEVASQETAEVAVGALGWNGDELSAPVTVRNLGGHALPSGVGFRRLFLEVEVLGPRDEILWASGRTNEIGMILKGTTGEPLATETFHAGRDGLPFQPHRQVITDEDQAQIYEELVQSSSLQFTTSFLHRYWIIKDNRLRPPGWNPSNVTDPAQRTEYTAATQPGTGPERNWWPAPPPVAYKNPAFPAIDRYTDTRGDPDYTITAHPTTGLPGTDQVTYRMRLSPAAKQVARRVRVTLYSQSTPPYFFDQRFAAAAKAGAERVAAQRMYYMAGHLNTSAPAPDGKPYLAGYRLQVGRAVFGAVPAR